MTSDASTGGGGGVGGGGSGGGGSATPEDIERAVAILRDGGVVGFPTETVYGLAADASNPAAVDRVFAIKGRPAGHPLIVHLASAALLDEWTVGAPVDAVALAEAFWPGPLTMVLRRSPRVIDAVTGGRPTVAVRVPRHPVAQEVLRRFGGGLAAPSANRFGRVSPTTADHVRADLGDEVDLVLDGGPSVVGVESTIVDLTGPAPQVLRLGAIGAADVAMVLDRTVVGLPSVIDAPVGEVGAGFESADGGEPAGGERERGNGSGFAGGAKAPGMLAAHYAPAAEVRVVETGEAAASAARAVVDAVPGARVGLLAPTVVDGLPGAVVELEPAGPPDHYASVLYDRLRQADRLGVDLLLVVPPTADGIGVAVRDRLQRAATGSRR